MSHLGYSDFFVRVVDVINNYEAQLDQMHQELQLLRKQTINHQSSHIGSYGDIKSESAASEMQGLAVVSEADSSASVETLGESKPGIVSPSPLTGSGGKWQEEARVATEAKMESRLVEEKLLVSLSELFLGA